MNTLSKILLFVLLGLLVISAYIYFFIYKPEQENLVKQIESSTKLITKQKEDNKILSDSLNALVINKRQDSIVYVYKTKYIYVNTQTNEAIKTFYSTASDSAKISVFSNLLRDTTFKRGSYNTNGIKSNKR